MTAEQKNTDVERQKETRRQARIVKTVHPSQQSMKRRLELESDLMQWFPYYFQNVFYKPFGKVHFRAGRKLQGCIETGGRFAFSMARASGKSAFGKPACCYCALSGKSKFPVALGATAKLTTSYHDFVKIALMSNPKLMEDYPEICCFFQATDGKAIRAHNQLFENGELTGLKLKDDHISLPMARDPSGELYRGAGSAVFFRSMDSAIRGITETMQDGTIIRPTIVFPDDIQTNQVAASNVLSEKMENTMLSSVLGLAGPDTKLACFMPGTVQRKGDFFSRFLDRKLHPDFQGENVAMIIKWPDALDTLWKEYEVIWREDQEEDKGLERAFQFLRDNWDAMHAGSEMSWDERIREGELSALQTAMHYWYEIGDLFFAEYQGEPLDVMKGLYRLSVEQMKQHISDLRPREIPAGFDVLTGLGDINRSGIHWCMGAFTNNMTCHVPLYGNANDKGFLWKENAPTHEIDNGIFNGLKEACDTIENTIFLRDGKRVKPDLFLIDRGSWPEAVRQFCEQARYSFQVMPCLGYDSVKYTPAPKKMRGGAKHRCFHHKGVDFGPYVANDAPYWRETAQRSLLGTAGAPGTTALFHDHSRKPHNDFFAHLMNRVLLSKTDTQRGLEYKWHDTDPHDWLDAFVGCWVGAAFLGLTPSGFVPVIKNKKRQRKIRHVSY